MCQQFRYAELVCKGIRSPLATYCEVAGVGVEGASLSTHARVDRGSKIGVANYLMFRTSELMTGFEEAAKLNVVARGEDDEAAVPTATSEALIP